MAAAGCAARDQAPAPPGENGERMRYLALGDSYTIGESVTEDARWPVQLAARLANAGVAVAPPEIVARTGWTTDELETAIDAARPRGPYDLVTLLIGVNDQYRGRELGEYRRRLDSLLVRARSLAGGDAERVILLSIPDWGVTPFAAGRDRAEISRAIDRFNQAGRAEAATAGVHWVDVTPASRRAASEPDLIASDGLHPSHAMYAAWVELVLPAAQEAMRSRRR